MPHRALCLFPPQLVVVKFPARLTTTYRGDIVEDVHDRDHDNLGKPAEGCEKCEERAARRGQFKSFGRGEGEHPIEPEIDSKEI